VHLFHVAAHFQRPCKEDVANPRRRAWAGSAGLDLPVRPRTLQAS
jgi:hypothetical protein